MNYTPQTSAICLGGTAVFCGFYEGVLVNGLLKGLF